MMGSVDTTIGLLERLVGFPTVSASSNLELVQFVEAYLADHGVEVSLSFDATGRKANVFATIGPRVDGGVVLCGHTDVVPVDDQRWNSEPFALMRRNGRLYGRGSADMKGFIACALAQVPAYLATPLQVPVHLAFTFDEEVGSCGAPILVEQIRELPYRPRIAIVGEPTSMRLISGHKGGYEMITTVTGLEGHASDPRRGVNAISYATRFIERLDRIAADLAAHPDATTPFDPAYTTISVGTIHGGTARNVIPGTCSFDWEIRPVGRDDCREILAAMDAYVRDELLPEMRARSPSADVATHLFAACPGLVHDPDSEAIALVRELTGLNATEVVPFGTDAGHLQEGGMSCVVFGPGSIEQAHKPDEFIAVDQLQACLGFLDRLREWLSTPGRK